MPNITSTMKIRNPLLLRSLSAAIFRGTLPAFYSTQIVGDNPILVRDYIRSALYDPNHGYFSKLSGPVGLLERSIRFNQIQGRAAYLKLLDSLYKQQDIAWFTPVELFKIYEIGGGSGTCAKCIMDYMMLNAPPKVYNNMTYTSVEISPSLAKRQLETVGEVQNHLARYNVECRDATDKNGWGDVEPQPCWVIMLEVLDNLPHDLIYSPHQVSPWMEVWLEKVHDSFQVSEVYKPLEDTLISQCVKIIDKDLDTNRNKLSSTARKLWSKAFPKPRKAWLPTGCLQLLEVLHGALPKMSLIASDFSYLPDIKVDGDRAPLVSSKKDGRTVDHSSYLDAKGDADIFFPTDFWLLERIDHHCSGWSHELTGSASSKPVRKRRTITLDTAGFMEQFGLPTKTRTKDGYNPLLDDFRNTKFYLSVPTHNAN